MSGEDTTRSMWRSAAQFFGGTLFSRITGMLRDMTTAFAFGSHPSVAAFLMAYRFAHLLRRLLGEGAMQTAIVPQFEGLRADSPYRAASFFRDLVASLSVVLLVLVLVGELGLWAALSFLTVTPESAEVIRLTAWMLPSLLFICLFGVNVALLQCEKRYFLAGISPAIFNLIWIAATLGLTGMEAAEAMPYLAVAVIVACIGNWCMTAPAASRALRQAGVSFFRSIKLFSSDVRGLWGPLTLSILGVSAAQLNSALDAVFARYADLSGPAHLWYASRVQQLPMALFGIALAGALLPPLSRAARSDDHARFGSLLCFALERSYLLIFSCTCLLFFGGYSVIDLLFGHGEFSDTDALHTTHCLWAYSAGLLPIVWILITASAFYARGDYQTPTKAALAGMGTNVAANTLCIGVFGAGAWSVAAATSVAAFVNAGWLLQALIKQGHFQWSTELSRRLQKSTVSCTAATLAALAFLSVLPNFYTKGSTTQNLIDCVGLGLVYTGVLAGLEWKKRSGQFA